MTTFETFGTTELAEHEQAQIVEALNRQAADMAEHWVNYAEGREDRFLAYFMRDDPVHAVMLDMFLDKIEAPTELPDNEKQAVIKTGRAILWAYSNTDEKNRPFDVMYVGERVEPVQ